MVDTSKPFVHYQHRKYRDGRGWRAKRLRYDASKARDIEKLTRRTDNDLNNLDPDMPIVYIVQDQYDMAHIQPGKHVPHQAKYKAPTRQHKLDHADHQGYA